MKKYILIILIIWALVFCVTSFLYRKNQDKFTIHTIKLKTTRVHFSKLEMDSTLVEIQFYIILEKDYLSDENSEKKIVFLGLVEPGIKGNISSKNPYKLILNINQNKYDVSKISFLNDSLDMRNNCCGKKDLYLTKSNFLNFLKLLFSDSKLTNGIKLNRTKIYFNLNFKFQNIVGYKNNTTLVLSRK